MGKDRIIHEPSSAKEREALDAERRREDKVEQLGEGFHLVPRGRDGVVYYREGMRVLELPYEMDGRQPGILLYVDGLDRWVLPARTATSAADRQRLRAALEQWTQQHRGKVTLVSRADLVRPWEDE